MLLKEFYTYDLGKIIKEIISRKASKVLLQLPNGIKRFSRELISDIISNLRRSGYDKDITIDIDGNPIYGSCLIDLNLIRNYELVLHFAHEPYPYWEAPSNVVFIDLLSKAKPSNNTLEKLVRMLTEMNVKYLAIYITPQHKLIVSDIVKYLKSRDIMIINRPKVITGCWFADLDLFLDKVHAVLVIAGGMFHALGLGLRIKASKHVLVLDPYSDKVKDVTKDVVKVLKVRLWKISKALNAKSWLIIVGSAGQYRYTIIKEVTGILKKNNRNFHIVRTTYLTHDILRNIDGSDIEAIIITSCPRLAIEDFTKYDKPVLTPGEVMYMFGLREDYTYPW